MFGRGKCLCRKNAVNLYGPPTASMPFLSGDGTKERQRRSARAGSAELPERRPVRAARSGARHLARGARAVQPRKGREAAFAARFRCFANSAPLWSWRRKPRSQQRTAVVAEACQERAAPRADPGRCRSPRWALLQRVPPARPGPATPAPHTAPERLDPPRSRSPTKFEAAGSAQQALPPLFPRPAHNGRSAPVPPRASKAAAVPGTPQRCPVPAEDGGGPLPRLPAHASAAQKVSWRQRGRAMDPACCRLAARRDAAPGLPLPPAGRPLGRREGGGRRGEGGGGAEGRSAQLRTLLQLRPRGGWRCSEGERARGRGGGARRGKGREEEARRRARSHGAPVTPSLSESVAPGATRGNAALSAAPQEEGNARDARNSAPRPAPWLVFVKLWPLSRKSDEVSKRECELVAQSCSREQWWREEGDGGTCTHLGLICSKSFGTD